MEAAAPLWKYPLRLTNELGMVQSTISAPGTKKRAENTSQCFPQAAESYMNDLN